MAASPTVVATVITAPIQIVDADVGPWPVVWVQVFGDRRLKAQTGRGHGLL